MKRMSRLSIQVLLVELFFPFMGIYALLRYRAIQIAGIVIPLFFVYIGMSKILFLDSVVLNDSERDVLDFLYWSKVNLVSLNDYFNSLQNAQQIDYYLPFMKWLISRISDNYRFFLGMLMLVYGIFYSKNITFMMKVSNRDKLSLLLLLTLFLIPNPNFYTHRWWLALQLFISGLLPYVFEGKIKYLLLSTSAIFVHFSFLYPLLLILLFVIYPKAKLYPFVVAFVVTNLFENFDLNNLIVIVQNYLPIRFVERSEMYINADFVEGNLFSQLPRYIWKYLNLVFALILYFKYHHDLKENDVLRKLYIITLLLGSFSLVMNCVPWGWRFFDMSNYLFSCLMIYVLSINRLSVLSSFLKLCIPCYIFLSLFQIRGLLCIIGIKSLLFGNLFTTYFFEDCISVIDMIKTI